MIPPTAPSAASDDDGGGRSLSVATSHAGLGSDGGRGGTAPPSVDGVVIDRFDGEDGKQASTTHRRPSSVPPLPLGKPEVAPSSSASPPAAGSRRKNSFMAKLMASWQFAQRKRLRRQGKKREVLRGRGFVFVSLSLEPALSFPCSVFSFPPHAPLPSLSPLQKFTQKTTTSDALDFLGYAILGLLSYASEFRLSLSHFGCLVRRRPLPNDDGVSLLVLLPLLLSSSSLPPFPPRPLRSPPSPPLHTHTHTHTKQPATSSSAPRCSREARCGRSSSSGSRHRPAAP
jgi:hypothetical protein